MPPGPVPPPDPAAPAGEFGFTFDRSGYRVPAIVVSPWVEPGSVYNEEYRHTSLIATLRKTWDLGDAFTQRDASARTFDHVFTRETPRDPQTWATVAAQPVPAWAIDYRPCGKALGYLGKDIGTRHHRARQADGGQTPTATRRPLAPNSRPSSSSKSSGTSPSTTSPSWRRVAQAIATEPTSHRCVLLPAHASSPEHGGRCASRPPRNHLYSSSAEN